MTPIEQAFTDLSHAEKKDPAWVIRDTLPVGLTFMAGPPKVSHKSTLTMILAALCVRTGDAGGLPLWMEAILGGPVMVFSYEADAGEVRSIWEDGLAMTVPPRSVYIATDPWMFQLDQPGSMEQLMMYLDQKMPRLVVMDPFRNMWSGDENDSGAIIKTLGPVQRWLKRNEAAGIVVHHVNKPPASNASADWSPGGMFAMRGSSAIPGLSDGIIVIEPTPHEGQIIMHTKFKRGPPWRRRLQIGAPGHGWPARGYEIPPEAAMAVQDAWNKRAPHTDPLAWMATACANMKCASGAVRQHLLCLDRNRLAQFDDRERRTLLLGEVEEES